MYMADKRWLWVVLLVTLCLCGAPVSAADRPPENEIVARVNGAPIDRAEFEREVRLATQRATQMERLSTRSASRDCDRRPLSIL